MNLILNKTLDLLAYRKDDLESSFLHNYLLFRISTIS